MLNNVGDMIAFFKKPDDFSAAIQYSAGRFEFTSTLIEKDYLCSLVLKYLYSHDIPLIFKGGTLLSKAHTVFNRLSEDLDFSIHVLPSEKRSQRSNKIAPIKKLLNYLNKELPIFTIEKELTGSDNSRQYGMTLAYQSNINRQHNRILIDIGLRDEILMPTENVKIRTLLMDPFLNENKVQIFTVFGLNLQEAYAEKVRAALYREKVAIRDFYDLDHALVNGLVDFDDKDFIELVKKKIKYEKREHNLRNPEIFKFLQSKIKSELEPTLKRSESSLFKLERTVDVLSTLIINLK